MISLMIMKRAGKAAATVLFLPYIIQWSRVGKYSGEKVNGYSGVLQSHLSSCNRRAASWCDTSLRFQSRSWYTVRRLFDGTANKFLAKSRAEQRQRRQAGRGRERRGSWSHKTPIAVAHHTTSMCAELCKQADSKHTQHHQFQACSSGQPQSSLPPSVSPHCSVLLEIIIAEHLSYALWPTSCR